MSHEISRIAAKGRLKCRKKFLYYFRKGFKDPKYIDWNEITNGKLISRGRMNSTGTNINYYFPQKNIQKLLKEQYDWNPEQIFFSHLKKWRYAMQ